MSRFLALATATLLLGAACSSSAGPPDGQTGITVQDNSFSPSSRTISVGQTVTWTWSGGNTHNVTWDTGVPAASATQSSGTYQRTFAQTGTFDYHCTLHGGVGSGMHGTVTVQ